MGSLCFIQPPSAKASEAKTFIGQIEKVTLLISQPPKWTYAKFTAVADNGEKKDIYVLKATAMTDVDGKPIKGAALKKDKKVEVKYTTAENGRNEASSIRYVPLDYVPQSTGPAAPERAAPEATPRVNDTLIGKIISVKGIIPRLRWSLLPSKYTYCEIVIMADNGDESKLFITKETTLTDAKGITSSSYFVPKKGERVEAKYSITEKGLIEATSIRYLPPDSGQ
jgi:hypothetical protein